MSQRLVDEASRSLSLISTRRCPHAGAVGWGGKSILVVGQSGFGKTSLTRGSPPSLRLSLATKIVILANEGTIGLFPTASVQAGIAEPPAWQRDDAEIVSISGGSRKSSSRTRSAVDERAAVRCHLSRHRPNAGLAIEPISAAATGLTPDGMHLNAAQLGRRWLQGNHGVCTSRRPSRVDIGLRAVGRYSGPLVRTVVDNHFDVARSRRSCPPRRRRCGSPFPRTDRRCGTESRGPFADPAGRQRK